MKKRRDPIHIDDLKEAFNVVGKRDVVRSHGWRKTDRIEYALRELFRKGNFQDLRNRSGLRIILHRPMRVLRAKL